MMKSILIGIPTYNGAYLVNNCLNSIYKWNDIPPGYKVNILIIDDGSKVEELPDIIKVSQMFNVPVIFHEENMGIPKSWNDIGKYGNSDITVWLNNDILVSKDWLSCVTYFLTQNESVGAVGWNIENIPGAAVPIVLLEDEPVHLPSMTLTDEPGTRTSEDIRSQAEVPGKIMCAIGCCFAVTRDKYEMIKGGFDERIKSFYEETLFFSLLTQLGYPSYHVPYPFLYHLWSATFGANPELKPAERLKVGKKIYCEVFNVPVEFSDNPAKYVDPLLMNKLEPTNIKWLNEDLKEREGII